MASQERSPHGARLVWTHRPRHPRGVVLLLHGGQERGLRATSWRQPSVLRMLPFAAAIGRRGRLSVALCRYSVRGWNEAAHPVRDARWALHRVEAACPGLPVGLVGYSMGGRAALLLAGEGRARALVTLAAWVVPQELARCEPAAGMAALLLHGGADRVTDPQGSRTAAQVLHRAGVSTEVVVVPGDSHTMLRHPLRWHRRTADFMAQTLTP